MIPQRSTRVLFLDDSGKPSKSDATQAVVIGGFSILSQNVHRFDLQIAGAKARFHPDRGDPGKWELKAGQTITPNPWNRSKNRSLVKETQRILGQLDGTVYTVTIDKRRLHHEMPLNKTTPLQLQALVEHFAVECDEHNETGMIVSDWSNHSLDAHASVCVATFVKSRSLSLHPGVYYANSKTSHAIQLADLVSGIRRRSAEGDPKLQTTDKELAKIRTLGLSAPNTHEGRRYTNRIQLF